MNDIHLLRAIQDSLNQSRYAEARCLVYRAIVDEQKRMADQKQQRPESDLGASTATL